MKKIILLAIAMMLFCVGCSKNSEETNTDTGTEKAYKNDVAVQALRDAAAAALGEDYWPNMAMGETELETFTGVTNDLYDEFVAEMPMISTNVDTLVILKAKEGKETAAEEALNAYKKKLEEDTMQYPMNLGKIQASMVTRMGQYVFFVQLGADTMAASEESEEAVIKFCQEANQKALDAMEKVLQD